MVLRASGFHALLHFLTLQSALYAWNDLQSFKPLHLLLVFIFFIPIGALNQVGSCAKAERAEGL